MLKPADPAVSIIIPTLNEAGCIGETLESLRAQNDAPEVIVADGGSSDSTVEVARRSGARVLLAPRGRGSQLHVGACHARGRALWFLHADTRPPRNAVQSIRTALADRSVVGGNFALRFDGVARSARFLSWLYPHLASLGLCYGDSAIFVRRRVYFDVGGFRPFPIFEDLDLISRLKREGRFLRVPAEVVTSSRRFEGRSFPLTFAHWTALQALYWLGVSPGALGRLYRPVRQAKQEVSCE